MQASTADYAQRPPSARQQQLLESAYRYALEHGLAELSLRPLAAAIGSSPRVLLYLFGSKDGLVRALLARARTDQLELLEHAGSPSEQRDLSATVELVWRWLADETHRPLLGLWVEAYARSLVSPDALWAGFARQTVADWLTVLAAAQPPSRRKTKAGAAQRTLALSVLRGALLDLLATGDTDRTTRAVNQHLATLRQIS
ncbi:MAG: TetR/AcrR family transcriptional regulator [Solirubrobacterales bacterium]|nr:TetR/AcrR family transcriptional regulator [Solirubrobacterales bacterium]